MKFITNKIKTLGMRVLLIADVSHTPGLDFVNLFKDLGYKVFHVGIDSRQFNTVHCGRSIMQFFSPNGYGERPGHRFELESLLDMIGMNFNNFDMIFHVDDGTYPTMKNGLKSPIPYFYYCTEGLSPTMPSPTWVVLCGTWNIQQIILRQFPTIKTMFTPYPWISPKYKIPKRNNNKNIHVSFAGELYKFVGIYKERETVVKYVKEHLHEKYPSEFHYLKKQDEQKPQSIREPESGQGLLNITDYYDLLSRSRIGLNIPTNMGMNFKDVEIPAHGAMLLTKKTKDLEQMGFVDHVNCRYFKDEKHALAIIESMSFDDIERIANNGFDLIYRGREYWAHKQMLGWVYEIGDTVRIMWDKEYYLKHKDKVRLNVLPNITFEPFHDDYIMMEIMTRFEDMQSLHQIMTQLGFQHSKTPGHTIYHRMRQIANVIQQFTRVNPEIKRIEGMTPK